MFWLPTKSAPIRRVDSASTVRSVSWASSIENSLTTAKASNPRFSRWGCTNLAKCRNSSKSAAICSRMPGRRIFKTTCSPPVSSARCTWAMEAAAMATSSIRLNSVLSFGPSSFLRTAATPAFPDQGAAGTLHCNFFNSSTQSCGIRSGRVLMICPILTNVGPRHWRSNRTRTGIVSAASWPECFARLS